MTDIWTARLLTAKVYAVSDQNIGVQVFGPPQTVLTTFTVKGAFLTAAPPDQGGTGEPQSGNWVTASWANPQPIVVPPYVATVSMNGLAANTYYVWVQITDSSSGELPALYAGVLFVE